MCNSGRPESPSLPYSREQIDQMEDTLEEWRVREMAVTRALFAYTFVEGAAREMMQHGFSRRVADLKHTLERLFEVLPPEANAPTQRDIRDATAFLQAFVINTFGAIDNLAWVWALEARITDGGKPLKRKHIGLTAGNATLRGSLSDATQTYLKGTDGWFTYLEDYRHALAHRVPLYIPPKMFNDADTAEFRRLEAEMLAEGWSWERWHEVQNGQRQLGVFEPVMMHSYGEGARPVRFHAQMISDFATVIEIAEHVINDLQGLQRPHAESAGR